jgi:prepilin signal peptidase PulO-like enzyme (type II secretory pathway)
METILLAIYFLVFFLFIGSFLNVVAIRTLEGTSVLNPRHSHCPHCDTQLGWRDLIPVLSWLFLRGRCRTCKAPVSGLYPLGEMGTALVLTFVAVRGGWSTSGQLLETFVSLILFVFLLALTMTDIRAKLMPNKIVYPGLLLMLLLRLLIHPEPIWMYAIGFVVGGGLLTLLALVPNGMGGGDIKLFALIGLAFGWQTVLFALFFASVWGTLIGLPLKWAGKIKPRQPIPFGPFILLGTLTAWAYGADIWHWYLRLYA